MKNAATQTLSSRMWVHTNVHKGQLGHHSPGRMWEGCEVGDRGVEEETRVNFVLTPPPSSHLEAFCISHLDTMCLIMEVHC
jgi:hypothetical protein